MSLIYLLPLTRNYIRLLVDDIIFDGIIIFQCIHLLGFLVNNNMQIL